MMHTLIYMMHVVMHVCMVLIANGDDLAGYIDLESINQLGS